ncbi:hypothetical protein QE152_g8566 [Popillia japonica]|uniref:Uncharacterized protein n=1 Tax=Popillia japonica TaxID=7064 RepID=A0AAW1M2Z7_POPJA
MDEILYSKPEIHAVATCSSKSALIVKGTTKKNTEDQHLNRTPIFWQNRTVVILTVNNEVGRKFNSNFMTKRKRTESTMERRHREKWLHRI